MFMMIDIYCVSVVFTFGRIWETIRDWSLITGRGGGVATKWENIFAGPPFKRWTHF